VDVNKEITQIAVKMQHNELYDNIKGTSKSRQGIYMSREGLSKIVRTRITSILYAGEGVGSRVFTGEPLTSDMIEVLRNTKKRTQSALIKELKKLIDAEIAKN
jgi:hypothetical protein